MQQAIAAMQRGCLATVGVTLMADVPVPIAVTWGAAVRPATVCRGMLV